MAKHHFISYSRADGKEFALWLYDKLKSDPNQYKVWMDRRDMSSSGPEWDDQVVEALRQCDSLLLVVTQDSVTSLSGCKDEWTRALRYKKLIIPLLIDDEAEKPYRLENRQHIDFTGDWEAGLSQLRLDLEKTYTPQGKLWQLKYRLADAHREQNRTDNEHQLKRIANDIAELNHEIEGLELFIEDPEAAKAKTQASITSGLERERAPSQKSSGETHTKFINPPPGLAAHFQDRHVETKIVADFLKTPGKRMITVIGRGGVGKTAMVCRLLKSIESGKLPDELGDFSLDGIVYLSEQTYRKVNFANIFADLSRLLPRQKADDLEQHYRNPQLSTSDKINLLLEALAGQRVALLLDNFEDKLDKDGEHLNDEELEEALLAILKAADHQLKVIITTRQGAKQLQLTQPGRQERLDLDAGLPSPHAENLLREMDPHGILGLRGAEDSLLYRARQRTRGYPRALEALAGILSTDRDSTLEDLLAEEDTTLPENVVKDLVGEAFSRLNESMQQAMQALAIFGSPVPPSAVDFLLQPFVAGINSAPILKRLVNMHYVRSEAGSYYLHQVDREYALSLLEEGSPEDRFADKLVFSRYGLSSRGADYFAQARKPRKDWKTREDLSAQEAEFELRFAAGDYDTAANVLLTIDFHYLMLWGHSRLVQEYHLDLQGKIEDKNLIGRSLNNLGICYLNQGNYGKAIDYLEQYLLLSREVDNRSGEGASLGNLGICYFSQGDYVKAIDYQEQSLAISREIGDRGGEGISLGSLGSCYYSQGDYVKAIDYQEQSLAISREIGDRGGEGISLGSLGSCYYSQGDYVKAIDYFEQHLAISREVGDRGGEGGALSNLGICYFSQGDYVKAIDYQEQSLAIFREIGSRDGEAHALSNSGSVLLFRQEPASARNNLENAIAIWEETGSPDVVEAYCLLGIALLYSEKRTEGAAVFEQAIEQGNKYLQETDRVETLEFKGLALCGWAICKQDAAVAFAAKETFAKTRTITTAKGLLERTSKFFDLLAAKDENNLLAGVREVLAVGLSPKQ